MLFYAEWEELKSDRSLHSHLLTPQPFSICSDPGTNKCSMGYLYFLLPRHLVQFFINDFYPPWFQFSSLLRLLVASCHLWLAALQIFLTIPKDNGTKKCLYQHNANLSLPKETFPSACSINGRTSSTFYIKKMLLNINSKIRLTQIPFQNQLYRVLNIFEFSPQCFTS